MAAKKVKQRDDTCPACRTKIINLSDLDFYKLYHCGKCERGFYVVRLKKDYQF